MDYTTITKTQKERIEKLQKIARPCKSESKIHRTYPDGREEEIYSNKKLNEFWINLNENYTKEWVMTFEQILNGFEMGIPWYEKEEKHVGPCPFCRIDPDMIDFCLAQRKIQIADKWKSLIWNTLWSSFGGVIASYLFKLLWQHPNKNNFLLLQFNKKQKELYL